MNWFQRHLHWTAVLVVLAVWPISFVTGFFFGYLDPSLVYAPTAVTALGMVTAFGVLAIGWGWVLREKARSAWWLLLALFVPFGFVCIFLLDNRSTAYPAAVQHHLPGHGVEDRLSVEYCEKCGRALEIRSTQHKGYDRRSGSPLYEVVLACPEAVLYETDVGSNKIGWRMGGGGHTAERRLISASDLDTLSDRVA